MLSFIASEAVFFMLLIIAYVYYRNSPANIPPATASGSLDVGRASIFSACLFASALTIWLAIRGLRQGNDRALRLWLLATIVLGAVFLIGQATEYMRLVNNSVTIDVDVFTSSYYTLTGVHDVHVLAGLIVLLVVLGLAQAGDFRHGAHADAVDSISWYWYFIIGVWVVNFALIYLWTLFQ